MTNLPAQTINSDDADRAAKIIRDALGIKRACALEGIVSKRLGSPYRSGRVDQWLKIKNPAARTVRRETEEDWDGRRRRR